MVNGIHRYPRRGRVTRTACRRRVDMQCAFSTRHGAVMARVACSQYLRMINLNYRYPAQCTMAQITPIGGRNMCRRFSHGEWRDAATLIVACYTRAYDMRMIDATDRAPLRRYMAGFAHVGRGVMSR